MTIETVAPSRKGVRSPSDLLLDTSVNYMLKYGGTAFCMLIADTKQITAILQLPYWEEILNNPLYAEEPLPLESTQNDADGVPQLIDRIASDASNNPEEIARLQSNKIVLQKLINTAGLSSEEKEILNRRFGLKCFTDSATLKEIADCLGKKHRQTIEQTVLIALKKLRYSLYQKSLTYNSF